MTESAHAGSAEHFYQDLAPLTDFNEFAEPAHFTAVPDGWHVVIADIEGSIGDFGARAREGKLTMAELTGGTFTITNGGIFGSMLSTPILNPPQSGILGMHNIVKRAVVVGDEIVARPMMYVALSYDHRIVDGKEAVTFLVKVKERLEDPERMVLDA